MCKVCCFLYFIDALRFNIFLFLFFREFHHFSNFYKTNWAMGLSMSFSAISITVTSPIIICIILNDKNNNNRTLINQLVVSIMCCALAWNLIVQTMMLFLYTFQPINNYLICHLTQLLPNIVTFDCLLLHDAIIIVKYIFISHLKNPTALQDDFWRIFINIWIFSFCLITQIIFQVLPGKESLSYYLCIGKIELAHLDQPLKKNYISNVAGNLSAILHLVFWIWKTTLKYHSKIQYDSYKEHKFQFKNSLNKEVLFHFVSHSIATVSLIAGMVYFPKLWRELNPIEVDSYPNFIFIYCQDLVVMNFCIICVISILLATKPNLLKEVMQELKKLF